MSDDSVQDLYRKWQNKKSETARQDFYSAVWVRYHSRLQVYLSPWLGKGAECEDRVSEILLGAFERIETYNSRYAFSTWIYSLARKRCIDGLRKKRIVTEELTADHGGAGETPESLLIKSEEKRLIGEAVSRLSAEDRELVFLYFYEEMKYREIAGITGKPLGTVKFRMSEIRKQMKSELSGSFV
ncbi:RNA polymerase sigma factor [Spirochaeta isovalerica]|uniref:RNA polymerase sigma-70 factor (ECF subfamily) n=1 Tax=Spirochaeta isovalerica TaxID=150 RepID=A0A841RAE7_9SPIO|nr:RNA polymerase sigma factor [Spirochaeta isovalerica]MBB6480217.1 RNA polymerase sigma-70 factor (ECF subfamily) [Spirochaeta isovalerica]